MIGTRKEGVQIWNLVNCNFSLREFLFLFFLLLWLRFLF